MPERIIIPMGKIIGPFGILGWLKIKTGTADSDSLSRYSQLLLQTNCTWINYKIEDFFTRDNIFHVKLENISNRDQAMAVKGTIVGIARDEFPSLDNDEYYQADLVGCNVYNKEQQLLGKIVDFMETGAHSIMVIKDDTTERLIPFVGAYVINVDLALDQITVDWGLDY